MNYTKLKAELELQAYAGLTNEQAAAALNIENIEAKQRVDYADVASYLSVVGKFLAISESTLASAKLYMLAASTFKTFNLSKPLVEMVIINSLDNLVDDGLINGTDKAAILSLAAAPSISRATQIGLGQVSAGHVNNARIS